MKKRIADKWVKALYSGEYGQTTGVLRDGNGFCCLGVLCDLAVKEKVIPPPTVKGSYGKEQKAGTLPIEVLKWSGMKSRYGIIQDDPEDQSLVGLNDDGYLFPEIADVIQLTYKEL